VTLIMIVMTMSGVVVVGIDGDVDDCSDSDDGTVKTVAAPDCSFQWSLQFLFPRGISMFSFLTSFLYY
jgi:hypothetical protein